MKLDESQINYSAMQVISETIGCIYDYSDREENFDNYRVAALGEISGIIKLADRLKEVLKA
jgi:hypothetical protein